MAVKFTIVFLVQQLTITESHVDDWILQVVLRKLY